MKKRIISVLIISTMILTLVACSKDEPTKTVNNNTVTNTPTVTEEVKPTEETKPTGTSDGNTEVTPTDTVDIIDSSNSEEDEILNTIREAFDFGELNKGDTAIIDNSESFEEIKGLIFEPDGRLRDSYSMTYNGDGTITYYNWVGDYSYLYKMSDDELLKFAEKVGLSPKFLEGKVGQIDSETGTFIYPELTDEIKEQVKNTILNDFDYTRELPSDDTPGNFGHMKSEVLNVIMDNYGKIYNPKELEELVNEYYPYTDKEDVDFIVQFTLAKGAGFINIKNTLIYYNLDVGLFDENSVDKDKILQQYVEDLVEKYPAITKQNIYNLLRDDGFDAKDSINIVERNYIILKEDALKEAIFKDDDLVIALDLKNNEENLKNYIKRYYEESTIDESKYISSNSGC